MHCDALAVKKMDHICNLTLPAEPHVHNKNVATRSPSMCSVLGFGRIKTSVSHHRGSNLWLVMLCFGGAYTYVIYSPSPPCTGRLELGGRKHSTY
ncbi:hypothetical protein K440DRAFT_74655 [Wilcoxina mikolae CBS 423.85]|nr:hypothetical protein K440DRAFT_74655 [Wilcoxina mikolae CBS 423.85]